MVNGGIYIKHLINNGSSVEDFQIELLGIYPLEECLEKEASLAKTSLFPKGLNGNAGSHIEMTEEVFKKMSKAARKNNKKRVKNGTHNFLGSENNRKRVEEGTHHFLDSEAARKNNLKRVENGTHHLLSKNRVTALNIETGEVHRIPTELYHSRRDIYFANTSKFFKEWKKDNQI